MTESKPAHRTARYSFFRSKPGRCGHRRSLLTPTRYGWVYLVLLIGMLGGSVNYGNNFGFLLTFLLAGVGTVSLLHTWRGLRGIALVSARAAPVFAGITSFVLFLAGVGTTVYFIHMKTTDESS